MENLRIGVAGTGPEVGKTLASSILTKALQADYWKPVQCGSLHACDTSRVRALINNPRSHCYPERYRFTQPISPHAAAAHAGQEIDGATFMLPASSRPLVIETSGGLLTPYADDLLQVDQFNRWNCAWVVVSKHYLGSINHTLLTLEALQKRKSRILGIIFNGDEDTASERVIMRYAQCPLIGRFYIQTSPILTELDSAIITTYANLWKLQLKKILAKR